ncbi:uncharacterized protein UMAG_10772 [Mycosarcoma maydis]|uniref:Stress-associated endoplasmic reticulum protein n=1 Tax=Mycosarcoma maydis TaxID=5270 RepID=A0A0D1CA49_MYCMD|nr:uncharacterized protein UMAG_10772 [Ustilago maydis 521]KIS70217.1 hypothetical protein UMAG_10772 [Ustilago maydis 521]|eukprot:XP_011388374.1 hypothetical protein UMAG_10772 [Ustilago maydis 521]
MPTFKDIRAKNAQFAASARENAGKARVRTSKDAPDSVEAKQSQQQGGRNIVKRARSDRRAQNKSAGLSNNKLALGLIVFVVCGGVFFELIRLFL